LQSYLASVHLLDSFDALPFLCLLKVVMLSFYKPATHAEYGSSWMTQKCLWLPKLCN
jgi:hypothetical protein